MPDQTKFSRGNAHESYRPAQLTKGDVWYISFYIWNPATERLERKRKKLNRIRDLKLRLAHARQVMDKINRDLAEGWNPLLEEMAPKGLHLLRDAMQTFLSRKLLEIEHDSKRTYRSQIKMLQEWLDATGRRDAFAVSFARQDANAYLDYLLHTKRVSERTYNNYLVFCRTLWNWLIERDYIYINPFLKLKKLKTKEKTRQPVPAEIRQRLREHLEQHDQGMLLAMYLMFYTEIRPSEQCKLRVCDIDLERQVITMHGDYSKNKKTRMPTIPDVFAEHLRGRGLDKLPANCYLLGKHFKPSFEKMDPREISRRWSKLRKELAIPIRYQFYSLRDTGIIHMLQEGVSANIVMQQAGHSDLKMTTVYARQAVTGADPQVKDLKGGF